MERYLFIGFIVATLVATFLSIILSVARAEPLPLEENKVPSVQLDGPMLFTKQIICGPFDTFKKEVLDPGQFFPILASKGDNEDEGKITVYSKRMKMAIVFTVNKFTSKDATDRNVCISEHFIDVRNFLSLGDSDENISSGKKF